MKRKFAGALILAVVVALPESAFPQGPRSRGGGAGGQGAGAGRAVSRGGGSSADGGSARASAPPPDSSNAGNDRATRGRNSPESDGGQAARSGGGSGDSDTVARGRGNPNDEGGVGHAVPRRPGSGSGGSTVIVAPGYWGGGFYPWAYGGLGFGGYYYGGFYDPWWYGDPGYASGYGYDDYEGSLRLKITPHNASVYVDGYFAGQVDDFDGVFQRLKIEPGPHRIEVREEGYEPLMFEVRILPDRTVTYTGTLEKATK